MTTEQSGSADQPNLGRRVARGATWMILLRFALRGIGLINTLILARLLVPEDFGLVALAMVTITLLDTFSEFGFDMALIQNQKATRAHYDTAWTIIIVKQLITAALLYLLAPVIADFFEEPRLIEVIHVLCVLPLLQGLRNIGVINFTKNLNFRKEFQLRISRKISAVCVVIPLAFVWRDYWALIAGLLAGRVVELVLSYVMHSYRPRLALSEWRSLFGFGKWMLINNAMTFLGSKLDTLLIGKFMDAKMVGIYNVSFEISNLPTTELLQPIARALYPGYSKIADDRTRMAESYLISLGLIFLIAAPLGVGIAVTAHHIIVVFLTEKWLEAVPFMAILALHGVLVIGGSNVAPVLLALNRPNVLAYLTIFQNVARFPLLIGGVVYYGAYGVAWALVATAAISTLAHVAVTLRLLRVSPAAFAGAFWRPLIALAAMVAAVTAFDAQWATEASTWAMAAELMAMVGIGAVSYVGTDLILWRLSGAPNGAERQIVQVLRERLARRTQVA